VVQPSDLLLARTVRHGGPWLVVLVVASLGEAALQLALPYLLGTTVDALVANSPDGRLRLTLSVAVIMGIVACESLNVRAAGSTGAQASFWLRRRVIERVLGIGPGVTRRFAEGDLVTRLGLNAEEAGQAPEALLASVSLLPSTVGSLIALVLIDPWMALTLIAGLVLVGVVLKTFLRDTTTIAVGYQQAQGDIAGRLIDALTGARTIAAAAAADTEIRRVLTPLPRLRGHGMALWRATARAGVQSGLAVPVLEIAVLAVGGFRLASGTLTVGGLYAAARYAVLGAGLSSALGSVSRLARARGAARRVGDLLAEEPVAYGARSLPPGPGQVEFDGVVLPGREDAVDLVIAGGSLTAVVGRSGSGKSLFAGVAGRLTDPDRGVVRLDGVALGDLSRRELRRAIGFAFERPILMGDTIGEAIAMGGDGYLEAARQAGADGFIRSIPDGYATALRDAPLSGGERQRLGLARAFAQGERLLVLDDATSSLDTVTERQVQGALTSDLAGRTRLIVAHRVATAARAERVIWLEDGRVRAHDEHRVLWQNPGYRAVFDSAACEPAQGEGRAV
jgi:ATP-binding cassette subfamily B protein